MRCTDFQREMHTTRLHDKRERDTHTETQQHIYRGKARRAAVLHTAVRLPCSSFVCFSREVAAEKSTCAEGQGKLHAGYIDLHTSPCHRGCMMSMNFPSTCRIRPGRPRPRNCLAGGKRKHRFAGARERRRGGVERHFFPRAHPKFFSPPLCPSPSSATFAQSPLPAALSAPVLSSVLPCRTTTTLCLWTQQPASSGLKRKPS